MNAVTFVTGGNRSGKSRYALSLALGRARRAFVATAEAIDDEMRRRIERHRADRGGSFRTVEAPLDLAGALASLPPGTEIAVVDCLTVWLANVLHARGARPDEDYPEVAAFLRAIERPPCDLAIVSNEVGLGVIAADARTRFYVDLAGRVNQEVARRADRVVFVVSGIPVVIKSGRMEGAALNPEPRTLNPEPRTLNPEP